jgi:hypothetical protein
MKKAALVMTSNVASLPGGFTPVQSHHNAGIK